MVVVVVGRLLGSCQSPGSDSSSGGDVGGALGGVTFVGGGLAVGAQCGGVEAGCALEFALGTAAGMEVGAMGPGTDGTGWLLGTAELVVPKS